jgi:hypothetical protein
MLQEQAEAEAAEDSHRFALSPQQVAFFDTFGFIRLPGLFREEAGRMVAGFEEVFADHHTPKWETHEAVHLRERRLIVPAIVDRTDKLRWLRDDPRVLGIIRSLMGEGAEYAESDGNLYWCETSWHADIYDSPLRVYHVKLSFYLDPLNGQNGAIRVIPGTNHFKETFAKALRRNLKDPDRIPELYGVDPVEIPSWTLTSDPGDVVAWNFRTLHASFNGSDRRRLFTMSFREAGDPAQDTE